MAIEKPKPAAPAPAPVQAPPPPPLAAPELASVQDEIARKRQELAALESRLPRQADAGPLTFANDDQYREWAGLDAATRTQMEADRRFGTAGQRFAVELPEHPRVIISALSELDAAGKYNLICGIRQTDKLHSVALAA